MKHSESRRFRRTAGASAVALALIVPGTAHAAQDYVVTLSPSAGMTCEATIAAVSYDYAISPKMTYTSSMCGFSASLSKRTVEDMRADPRVRSISADGAFTII